MAFITRNASITLLFMILFSLILLTVSTVYHQVKLVGINKKYDAQVASLTELQEKATATTDEVNRALKERELRLARGDQFATTYSQLKSEQETTEARRDRLRQEKSDMEGAIAGSQREFIDARNQEGATERDNTQLKVTINSLIEDKARKENLLRSLKKQLDDLQAQLAELKKSE